MFGHKVCVQAQTESNPTDSIPDTDSFDRNAQRSQAALSDESTTAGHIRKSSLRTVSSCLTYSLPKGGL